MKIQLLHALSLVACVLAVFFGLTDRMWGVVAVIIAWIAFSLYCLL